MRENPEKFVTGLFPKGYKDEIQRFNKLIVWKQVATATGKPQEIPEPVPGIDASFDAANQGVVEIKQELDAYLIEIRRRFDRDRRINFSHAKFRYEIEMPTEHVQGKKKPEDFEFTSQRKGFERFHTAEIKSMVDRLERKEEALKDAMVPFLAAIFGKFHDMKDVWTRIVNVLTEIDCLLSLSIASGQSEGEMTLPEFVPYEGEYAESS